MKIYASKLRRRIHLGRILILIDNDSFQVTRVFSLFIGWRPPRYKRVTREWRVSCGKLRGSPGTG